MIIIMYSGLDFTSTVLLLDHLSTVNQQSSTLPYSMFYVPQLARLVDLTHDVHTYLSASAATFTFCRSVVQECLSSLLVSYLVLL
jgi:hypothetical protein